jgi:hypothetical protein
MTFVNRPFALACVAVAAVTLSAFAQTSQLNPTLNPTVRVLSRPQSPVPAECATDIDTTAPALEPEAQPAPSTEAVPPSNSLRASLRRLQVAAEGDDYAAFKAALAEARRAVASHPAGGERNAANDAIQVYTDIARVWDYAMASPSGSFFDGSVQGGSLLSALKRYPDYGKTIASETIVAGDRTLYPTRETRRFLARESSRRLARLGVSVPARMGGPKPEWPRVTATPAPPVVKKPVQLATKTKPSSTPKKNVVPTKTPASPGTAGVPPASTSKKPLQRTTPIVSMKPPVATTSSPAPASTTETTAGGTPAVPGTTKPPVATTSSPAPASTTETTAGGTPAVPGTSVVSTQPLPTTTTAAPATDTTTTAPSEKASGNTNLIWAIVLILVGIGVLVILFKASD